MVHETDEATPALLIAGILMIAIGVMAATFPAGRLLGLVVTVIGVVLFVVVAIRGWRMWRKRPKQASAGPDPDRYWNAEVRVKSAMYVSLGTALGSLALSLWDPSPDRWITLCIFGSISIASGICFLLIRRHNRLKERRRPPAPVSNP